VFEMNKEQFMRVFVLLRSKRRKIDRAIMEE